MERQFEAKTLCPYCSEPLELESCAKLLIPRLLLTNFQWNTLATNICLVNDCQADYSVQLVFCLLVCFLFARLSYTTSLFCQVVSFVCVPHTPKYLWRYCLSFIKPIELEEQRALGHFGPTELFDHEKCKKRLCHGTQSSTSGTQLEQEEDEEDEEEEEESEEDST